MVRKHRPDKVRSKVHMLTVAAARLEHDHANPALVAALRDAAEEYAKARAEGRAHNSREQRRIDRQRSLFASVPQGDDFARLRGAMMQRVYDLMWDGDCAGADALAEFLPLARAEEAFSAWEHDQQPDGERTRFYDPRPEPEKAVPEPAADPPVPVIESKPGRTEAGKLTPPMEAFWRVLSQFAAAGRIPGVAEICAAAGVAKGSYGYMKEELIKRGYIEWDGELRILKEPA